MRRAGALLALVWLALWVHVGAAAHTRSESLSNWTVSGADVRVTVTVPEAEVLRLKPTGSGAESGAESGEAPTDSALAAYLAAHMGVSAAGATCPLAGAPVSPAAARGFRRVELQWRCPAAQDMALHSAAFFELVPTHLMYARLRFVGAGDDSGDGSGSSNDHFAEQLLSNERRSLSLDGGGSSSASLQSAGFVEYIALGLEHIVTGPDHIAFLLGLILVSGRFRDLALVITGFTLGHSVTLALAVTGWLRPAPELIDVLIALTIGLVGAENVVRATQRAGWVAAGVGLLLLAMAGLSLNGVGRLPLPLLLGAALFAPCYLLLTASLRDAAPLRAGVTAVFGLIHGFAFANDLIEMRLPAGRLAELLFGFNLGVELGQLSIVALLLGCAALLVKLRLAWPRPLVADSVSAALVGLSVFWIVGRTYG